MSFGLVASSGVSAVVGGPSGTLTAPVNVTVGHTLTVTVFVYGTTNVPVITKSSGTATIGTPAVDESTAAIDANHHVHIISVPITGSGSLTLAVNTTSAADSTWGWGEIDAALVKDTSWSNSDTYDPVTKDPITTGAGAASAACCVVGAMIDDGTNEGSSNAVTPSDTEIWAQSSFDTLPGWSQVRLNQAAGTVPALTWDTADFDAENGTFALAVAYKLASGGSTETDITPAGSSTPTGTLAKKVTKGLAGSSAPTGVAVRKTTKHPAGASTPTGVAVKKTGKLVAGSSTPTGALAVIRAILLALSGSSTPTGGLRRQTSKGLSGASTATSTLRRAIAKPFIGSSTPTGIARKATAKPLSGTSTPTGVVAVIRAILLALSGSSAPTGALRRAAGKSLAGASTSTGSIRKVVARAFAGSADATGALTKAIAKSLAGLVTAIGTVVTEFMSGLFHAPTDPAYLVVPESRLQTEYPDPRLRTEYPDSRLRTVYPGDSMDAIVITLGDVFDIADIAVKKVADNTALDLTNATVTLHVGTVENPLVDDEEVNVQDPPTDGKITIPKTVVAMLDQPGTFNGWLTATFSDSPPTTRQFPCDVVIRRPSDL